MLPCADFSKQSVSLGCPSCFRRAATSVACCPTISDRNFNHNMGPKSLTSQLHEPSGTLRRPLDVIPSPRKWLYGAHGCLQSAQLVPLPPMTMAHLQVTTRFEAALMTSRPTFGPMNLQARPNETIFQQVEDIPSVRATRREQPLCLSESQATRNKEGLC
jgi:hypothetical protein